MGRIKVKTDYSKAPHYKLTKQKMTGKTEAGLNEINRIRKILGMPALKNVMRYCLNCNERFEARGNNNRMCDRCRRV
jgi:hypothetical protein